MSSKPYHSMSKSKKALHIILYILSVILTIAAILSLFRNTESRFLKMLDFPRIQLFVFASLLLPVLLLLGSKKPWYRYSALLGLLTAILINGSYIINYTPLVSVTVAQAEEPLSEEATFSLLMINVKMTNKTVKPLIKLVKEKQPDIFLAMETDAWWDEHLEPLTKDYPHRQQVINDVSYGMTLYSKFPLDDFAVSYLNNNNVPSFESTLTLPNNKSFRLHTVHPVPPTHFKDLPDNKGQKEKAMILIGKKVVESDLPSVIAGDINDLVWSKTDELTKTQNLLHDARIGRGFYNSYNTKNPLARWPLDHVFVTKEFTLNKLERLSDIGSDHFPIYTELVLN